MPVPHIAEQCVGCKGSPTTRVQHRHVTKLPHVTPTVSNGTARIFLTAYNCPPQPHKPFRPRGPAFRAAA
eukprot:2515885-Rhodomonas_salina.1